MHRYNIVPLILIILFITSINFALAAPVLIPEGEKVSVDVVHVPKDVITVLRKRGDEIEKLAKLFDNFDRWWGDYPEYEAAPLESSHGPMQEHVPPANPASSTQSDRDPESLVSHPPTPSTASSSESDSERELMPSLESVSDLDRGAMNMDHHHDAPPPNPESLIESGHSHTLPSGPEWSTESEHGDAPPSSPGSDSNSALTHGNLGESSNAPATSATGGIPRRGAGMSLPGPSDYPKSREQSTSRGSANPMDEGF